jgi:uracil-DNA glycosylase
MTDHGTFPFGSKVRVLRQHDKSRKDVFVLGVYASAVHAKWLDAKGKQKVAALAVASEPEIFWTGDNPAKIISSIRMPASLGTLIPAGKRFNGPSGRSLDECFLKPLGIDRSVVWLCDLYPYAMLNANQRRAIRDRYARLASRYHLPKASLEPAPTRSPGKTRVEEVLAEIKKSAARTVILLGDRPIQWFLKEFQAEYKRLSDFGETPAKYGILHQFELSGYKVDVLPLVHPRQASGLGRSSAKWARLHERWMKRRAPKLFDRSA